jgi:hypothetical protein
MPSLLVGTQSADKEAVEGHLALPPNQSRDQSIDLRRLPAWQRYLISLVVIAAVSAIAWVVGRNQPVPGWITTYLIPLLGWAYIVLVLFVVAMWLRRR